MHYYFTLFFLSLSTMLFGQYEDIIMEDYVYVTNIKSVSFGPGGSTMDMPITYIDRGVELRLSFDDLEGDVKDYTYDIIHCDRNWVPSDLQKVEYIEGFVNEEIDGSTFSQGTYVPFTHYNMTIPNRDVSVILSGNYVLAVYDGELDDDERYPILTRRFVVVDNQVVIDAQTRRPLDVQKIDTHQEFDLYVTNRDYPIIDPELNLRVSIIQNGNWHNSIDTLVPRFIVGNKITIDNTGKISFPGLKEYRSLDIRSFDIVSNDIHTLELTDEGTDVLIKLGRPRAYGTYSAYPDANGAFIIDSKDDNNSVLQSDYANVIFSLSSPERDDDVYVIGKFTDWKADETYKMTYDYNREIYLASIEMKQGFYDYMFAVEKDGKLHPEYIEGSSYQTRNFYEIFVYVREPGDRYDRVVGYKKVISHF